MTNPIPFQFSIDHDRKTLEIVVNGRDGAELTVGLDCEQISELMAVLSQGLHGLVLSHAGQRVTLPLDPT